MESSADTQRYDVERIRRGDEDDIPAAFDEPLAPSDVVAKDGWINTVVISEVLHRDVSVGIGEIDHRLDAFAVIGPNHMVQFR